MMEKSESSKAAQVISVISMVFVAVSIVGMVISTVPALQIEVLQSTNLSNLEFANLFRMQMEN